MGISLANLVLILMIILVVFGAGKLPRVMGDLGKGLRNFRTGLKGEDEEQEATKLVESEAKAPLGKK